MKHALFSKTLWFNVLSTIATYSGLLPVNKYTVVAVGAVNFGLRIITNKPLTFTN